MSSENLMISYLKKKIYDPKYKKLLVKDVITNIWKEYISLLKKGFPVLSSDKPVSQGIHFTAKSWITIKLLAKNTSMALPFIVEYTEALYTLAYTGKIPLSNVNPSKKVTNPLVEEMKKTFQSLKITAPVALTLGAILSIMLLKK